jgi:hypothetical protein
MTFEFWKFKSTSELKELDAKIEKNQSPKSIVTK